MEPRKPAKGATTLVGRRGGEAWWLEREEVQRRPPSPKIKYHQEVSK